MKPEYVCTIKSTDFWR